MDEFPPCENKNAFVSSKRQRRKPLRYHSFCRGVDAPAAQVCPVTGAGRRGLLLFQPSAPRGSSPRPPVRLAPNGGSLCVLEAGTRPFLRILAIYSPILSASLRLVKNFYCQFCVPGAYWPLVEGAGGPVCRPCGFTRMHLNNGRAGEDTRPYENTGSCPVNAVGAGPRPARRSRILFGIRRRGQAPALQKTDAQKSGRKPFKAGGRVPTLRFYEGAFEQWTGEWGHPPLLERGEAPGLP